MTDDELLAELGIDLAPKQVRARTPREELIIAGFEDIVKFREEHGRAPQHGEGHDIFERLYAVRLDRLRALPECRALLAEMDTHGLLDGDAGDAPLDDDALLAELGVDATPDDDITQLRNVRSATERKAAEEIATAQRCEDFDRFKPLFDQVQAELEKGIRTTRRFGRDASIDVTDFFILRGQLAYVAEIIGEPIKAANGQNDARLRVIYSNGTESDLLRWSLQRALYKDEGGRRVTEPTAGPLFDAPEIEPDGDYLETGTLYVLRSRSTHSTIAAHRDLVHKIGITGGSVERRIAGAIDDPTFLLAEVDVIATYKLLDVDRPKLERLIHRVLDSVRFDAELTDRFGKPFRPREWFLVPLPVIDEIVQRIENGTLTGMKFDRQTASLVPETVI
ncbi:GIY-YIG nuclease family protein [Sphingomonas sp. R647]|uniref:GIY-YIG nuclease family protein n=1 Tax=Sphingomonas sp. R647 TaxID=2875233 RepID=UPI0021E5B11E|nr:GIY-YIG nuclease family protein [Sphingomonas sp. R647]